ncbi:MAG TPA: hypothetical protein PKD64_19935 [Pirellulaceae bacterium]|nr:hypothetical protein [Pirellulaceae bacterium]
MPRPRRIELFSPNEISICHLVQRCVRRMFLTGCDQVTGKDYTYRREWIRQRFEKLASVFGVDVLSYAIMSNHIHVVARNRPDVVDSWSDNEVALRWLQIFPGKRTEEQLGDPTSLDVEVLAKDKERIKVIRSRLSDFSWFMRALSEPIARRANREEECTGAFWEGRFKAQRILDETALLACCMYVDLNPIRAAMAETIEDSKFTSAYDRLKSVQGAKVESSAAAMQTISQEEAAKIRRESTPEELEARRKAAKKRKGPRVSRDAWLAPLSLDPSQKGSAANSSGVRASDRGFLNLKLKEYLELLEFTRRKGCADEHGNIPVDALKVLNQLKIESDMWCDLVWGFKRTFGRSRSAGHPDQMRDDAASHGRRYQPGQRKSKRLYVAR